jgi:hypothetical protein
MVDKSKYTHYAHFLWIPAYFNIHTNALEGRNWFYNLLIDYVAMPFQASVIWVLSFDPDYEPMWMIGIGEELERGQG